MAAPKTSPQQNAASQATTPSPGATQVVVEDIAGVQVMCNGAPATGLFVLFKSLPAEDDAVNKKLLQLVTQAFAYELPKEEPAPKFDPIIRAPYEFHYTLGFVDADGFLQPVMDGSNPWFEIHQSLETLKAQAKARGKKKVVPGPARPLNPHSFKIPEGTQCSLVLLRHPNPTLARALATYLNTGRDPAGWGFAQWGLKAQKATVQAESIEGGKQLRLTVPPVPDAYYPKGAGRYGGWTLYHDMPLMHLASVQQAVRQLTMDLGTLRYPVGDSPPYGPNGEIPPFDLTVKASVHAFQQDAAAGRAFKVEKRADAHDQAQSPRASDPHRYAKKASWAYLLGSEVTHATNLSKVRIEPGLVDKPTAEALASWLGADLRKPGDLLIEVAAVEKGVGGGRLASICWGRPELVASIELWRELILALGCPYGVSFGHTFRNLDEPGGVGKSETSIHKTGMAVDMSMVGSALGDIIYDYSRPRQHWPIRYEATWFASKWGPLTDAQRAYEQAQKTRQKAEQGLEAFHKEREAAQQALEQAQRELTEAQTKLDEALANLPPPEPPPVVKGKSKPRPPPDPLAAQKKDVQTKQRALEAKTRARSAYDGPDKLKRQAQLEKDVAAGKEREAQAKENLEKLQQKDADTKGFKRIRWRLYGHSTWDVFSVPPEEVARQLRDPARLGAPATPGGEWGITARYRQALLKCFPTPSKLAQEWVKPWAEKMQAAAQTLGSMEGQTLVSSFFREWLQQWLYNLFEADGGTTGPKVYAALDYEYAIDYLDPSVPMQATEVPQDAKSFVNLTALAWLAGLRRINANQAGWRDPLTDPNLVEKKRPAPVQKITLDATSFGPIAGLLERMKRPESAHADDKLVVSGQGRTVERLVAEVDHAFMGQWARTLKSLNKPKGPVSRSAQAATEVVITLTTLPADKAQVEQFLAPFGAYRFQRIFVGEHLDGAEMPMVATGAKWNELIAAEMDKLAQQRKADEEAAKQPQENSAQDMDGLAGGRRQKTAPKGAKPSTPKKTYQWVLILQPIFDLSETSPTTGQPYEVPLTFLYRDTVELATPGIGRALEWWHYETQVANQSTWGDMLTQLGYSDEILRAPGVPPQDDAGAFTAGRGLGFVSKQLDECKGGARGEPNVLPENSSESIPEGG